MATPFRARLSTEDLGSYLKEKQNYEIQNTGSSGVQLGTPSTSSLASLTTPVKTDYTYHPGESMDAYYQRTQGQSQAQALAPSTPLSTTTLGNYSGNTGTYNNDYLASMGAGSADTYRQQMVDLIAKLTEQGNAYTTAMQNQPKPEDTFNLYREKLGIPAKEAGLETAQQQLGSTNIQIQKTQAQLDDLEKQINARISGNRMMTEAQKARQLAVEQRPIMEQITALGRLAGTQQTGVTTDQAGVSSLQNQLSQMMQLAGQNQTQQLAAAKAPMEMTQSLLPTLTSMAGYQSPQEKYAQQVALYEAQQQAQQQYAIPKAPERVGTPDAGVWERDASGNWKNVIPAQKDTTGTGVETEQLYSGLSSPTATAVRARVSKFSTEPIIQNFATVQDGYNFSSSISDTTTNPADDQALIYSLAKALDPGSVVREGEYATAQKYAQSWIKAYGKGVSQALAGTGFLSEEARRNIKQTIKQKYLASKKSYDNLNKQYELGINSLTGRKNGSSFLVDYAIPTNSQENNNQITESTPNKEKSFWESASDFLFGND